MLLLQKALRLVGVLIRKFYHYFVSWIALLIVAMLGLLIYFKEKDLSLLQVDFFNNLLDTYLKAVGVTEFNYFNQYQYPDSYFEVVKMDAYQNLLIVTYIILLIVLHFKKYWRFITSSRVRNFFFIEETTEYERKDIYDVYDDIQQEKNRSFTLGERWQGTVQLIIILCIIFVGFYLVLPKDAWVSYRGDVTSLTAQVNDSPNGVPVNFSARYIRMDEGFVTNDQPMKIKIDNTTYEIESDELEIRTENLLFNRNVDFSGNMQMDYFTISGDTYGGSNKEFEGLEVEFFDKGQETIIVDGEKRDVTRHSNVMIATGDEPVTLTGDEVYLKGKKIDSNEIELLEIYPETHKPFDGKFGFYLTFKNHLHLNPWYGKQMQRNLTNFEINNLTTDAFNLFSYGESELSVIKTGKPENYSFINTQLVGNGDSIHIEGTLQPTKNGNDTYAINLSGTMYDLKAGNKSFFPNMIQWLNENFTAIVIAIMTVYITARFTNRKQT